MSRRAELLRLSLKSIKFLKAAGARGDVSIANIRRKHALLELIAPRPPAGTKTTTIDFDGINVVETLVRQARTDRCVVYFHGGAYAFGSERLVRDFTWRLGVATGASVLYFDYRLAPEHPFPAAVEDASKVYRWLAGRMIRRGLPLSAIRPAAASSLRRCTRCATKDSHYRGQQLRFRPGPISRSPAVPAQQRQIRSDDRRKAAAGVRPLLSRRS